jgi:hypothetical protein
MTALRMGRWALAAVLLAAMADRAEAQMMWEAGSVRYSSYRGPFGGVSAVQGPFGGGVAVAQGPFGGGAVGVRGPFGGGAVAVRGPFGGGAVAVRGPFGGTAVGVRGPFGGSVTVTGSGVVPVAPVGPFPVPVVRQTVLNPAPAPMPYSPAYMARIPPGYPMLQIADTNYFYTPVLPVDAQPATVGGMTYYLSNGVFYQPYFLGMRTVYVVAEL